MNDLIFKVIDDYIVSKEMREYLKNNIEHLQKWQIINMICGARADIRRKYETPKKLAELEQVDDTNDEILSYKATAEHAKELFCGTLSFMIMMA